MNINIYKNPVISCFVRYLGNGVVLFLFIFTHIRELLYFLLRMKYIFNCIHINIKI